MEDSYSIDSSLIDHSRLKQAVSDKNNFSPTTAEKKWFSLISKLPEDLCAALLLELKSGNVVTSIQYANWPQKGSVVISLESSFKIDFSEQRHGVIFRKLNDPHYWNADIHQIVNGVEYLIIS